MDRVQFVHSIDTGQIDYNTALINYFDQLMGVYGYIQPCNYKTEIVESSNDILILNMKFPNEDSALKICSILSMSDKRMNIYNRIFSIDVSTVSIDTIQLRLIPLQ